MRHKLPAIFVMGALLFLGAGCFGDKPVAAPQPVTLEYWRTDSPIGALDGIIDSYRKLHPHVSVNVTSLPALDYERKLLEALAENRGPDIFSLPNTSLGAWKGKLQSLPTEITIATQTVNDKKEIVWSLPKNPTVSVRQFIQTYNQTVSDELIWPEINKEEKTSTDRVWGFAYSIDNLALFYNRDLMRKAGISEPPTSWADFQQKAAQMTTLKDGRIAVSGAAIGGSDNVRHATEILTTLMRQNGAQMRRNNRMTLTAFTTETEGMPHPPAIEALIFYQSFANTNSTAYTWDGTMPDSLEAFITGRAAMYIGLPTDRDAIRQRSPKLDFGMSALPQIRPQAKVVAAVYPVEVVSMATAHANEAWDFLQFAADPANVVSYLEKTKLPAAALSLVDNQVKDEDAGAFAAQALIAKSWYDGTDYDKVRSAFKVMITWRPTEERPDYEYIVNIASSSINGTY